MAKKETLVISLGGSVLYSDGKFDSEKTSALASVLNGASKKFSIAVVVGGGFRAKRKVEAVRTAGGSEFEADVEAIHATRENAFRLLKMLEKPVFVKNFSDLHKIKRDLAEGKTLVAGGMMPGMTTDSIAVLFAEAVGAKRVINVSRAEGVYDSDPSKNPHAKLIPKMTHAQLVEMAIRADERKARTNFVFDLIACKLAARSKITLQFTGSNPQELQAAIFLKKAGTTVS